MGDQCLNLDFLNKGDYSIWKNLFFLISEEEDLEQALSLLERFTAFVGSPFGFLQYVLVKRTPASNHLHYTLSYLVRALELIEIFVMVEAELMKRDSKHVDKEELKEEQNKQPVNNTSENIENENKQPEVKKEMIKKQGEQKPINKQLMGK